MKFGGRALAVSLAFVVCLVLLGGLFRSAEDSSVKPGLHSLETKRWQSPERVELEAESNDRSGATEPRTNSLKKAELETGKGGPGAHSVRIVGRVVNVDGEGIADAQFRFLDTVPPWDYTAEESELPRGAKNGEFSILVDESAIKDCLVVWAGANYELKALELPGASNRLVRLGNIVLAQTAFIRGQVVDSLGIGISGALVSYSSGVSKWSDKSLPRLTDWLLGADDSTEEKGSLEEFKSCVSSEDDGSFVIPHLTGGWWTLSVSHGDYCSIQEIEVYLAKGHGSKVHIVLEQAFRLAFRTQDVDKNDIKGATVTLSAVHRNLFAKNDKESIQRVTDHEGLGQVDSCRFSPVRLTVEKSGFVDFAIDLRLDDQRTAVQNLTLYKGTVVKGHVVSTDKEIQSLRKRIVFLWRGDPRVHCGGLLRYGPDQFESEPLIPGPYRVIVAAKNHSIRVVDIELKESEQTYDMGELPLQPLCSVEVKVVDEKNEPVEGCVVGATNQGLSDFSRDGQKRPLPTNKEGRTRLNNVSPGIVSFYVLKQGYLTGYLDDALIPVSNGAVTICLTKQGGLIAGRVFNSGGELVKRGVVYLIRKGQERIHASAPVSREGSFLLTQVPVGIYKIIDDPKNSEAILKDPMGWFSVGLGESKNQNFYKAD